jgi:hypothetical protein
VANICRLWREQSRNDIADQGGGTRREASHPCWLEDIFRGVAKFSCLAGRVFPNCPNCFSQLFSQLKGLSDQPGLERFKLIFRGAHRQHTASLV